MAGGPVMSVLVPLQDERDAGEDCLRAWTHGQSVDADSYEVIALAPGEDPGLERAVRPLLRPQDRWIVAPGADEYELFNVGADAAKGDFVFITEAHCVPEPDCLAAMIDELERSGAPGIRGASVPDAHGPWGVLERDAAEPALRAEEDPGHWRKVLIHSLAIRRDVYIAAGGLPPRYGDFAPWVLAIALDTRDDQLRFSPRPRVRHVYDGDLEHLGAHIRSWGRGETRYRCEGDPALTEAYLEYSPEWESRAQTARWGAGRALRAGIALRHPSTTRDLLRHSVVALTGTRGAVAAARLGAARAGLGARVARNPERRKRRFLDFWRLTARRGRLEGLAEFDLGPAAVPAPGGTVDLFGDLSGAAVGFFGLEAPPSGAPYRWTSTLAALRVAVPGEGRVRARLTLRARPPDDPPATRVAVDGVRVAIRETGETIEFELDHGDRWITLACRPLRGVPGEPRRLGLCLEGLSFEPAGRQGQGRFAERPPPVHAGPGSTD